MRSGCSTSAIEASVNAPSNQQHHPAYDNAAYDGSDISSACHPPSRYEGSMTSAQTFMAEKDQEVAPNLDGLIPSSTTSILLASTPPMLPRWSLTDPSGRRLLEDCQSSNPSNEIHLWCVNISPQYGNKMMGELECYTIIINYYKTENGLLLDYDIGN